MRPEKKDRNHERNIVMTKKKNREHWKYIDTTGIILRQG